MSKLLSRICLAAFAAFGIFDLLREFWLWLLKTDCPGTYYVIPISGHNSKAEALLRNAAERAKWFGGGKTHIICADCGMDKETRQVCEKMCSENPEIIFCSIEQLVIIIKSENISLVK